MCSCYKNTLGLIEKDKVFIQKSRGQSEIGELPAQKLEGLRSQGESKNGKLLALKH